jgi:hypothetical protein
MCRNRRERFRAFEVWKNCLRRRLGASLGAACESIGATMMAEKEDSTVKKVVAATPAPAPVPAPSPAPIIVTLSPAALRDQMAIAILTVAIAGDRNMLLKHTADQYWTDYGVTCYRIADLILKARA